MKIRNSVKKNAAAFRKAVSGMVKSETGSTLVEMIVIIAIILILAALIFAWIYTQTNQTWLPNLGQKVNNIFNYQG